MKTVAAVKNRRIITLCFILFLGINALLLYIHEPWRDEVHAWLLAKNMSIPELIAFSGYEGHPVLWHIMLMPFAKMGGPIWVMNLLSYILVGVSAYIFMFQINFSTVGKIIILFTIPFLYIFSSIARNYCIVMLCIMCICAIYEKRYENPFLYSIFIAALVFTHAMAWGMVAGLTITLHFYELGRVILKKSDLEKKKIASMIAGLILIVSSSVFIVITMLHGRNAGYSAYRDSYTGEFVKVLMFIAVTIILYAVVVRPDTMKEAIVILCTILFQMIVYIKVYSNVGFQRTFLINVFLLFYLISTYKEKSIRENFLPLVLYYMPIVIFGGTQLKNTFIGDIKGGYSSAQEIAHYINSNITDQDVILVDSGVFEQTIVPYTDKILYDIVYQTDIEHSLYHVADYEATVSALQDIVNHEEYRGKYLIVYREYRISELAEAPFQEIYRTGKSVTGENYVLYHIEDKK